MKATVKKNWVLRVIEERVPKVPERAVQQLKKYGPIVVALLFLVLSVAAFHYYRQYSTLKKNPQEFARREAKQLVKQLSELIVLPEGEEPTVATVADLEKLQNQPFFAHAKKGDKVVIYSKARKAILYDPAAHKIVEVAPLNIPVNP